MKLQYNNNHSKLNMIWSNKTCEFLEVAEDATNAVLAILKYRYRLLVGKSV